MGWVHVRGHWLNLGAVVFARRLKGEGLLPDIVQVSVNAPDPLGAREQNDHTGLVSFVYVGDDARTIWRAFRL